VLASGLAQPERGPDEEGNGSRRGRRSFPCEESEGGPPRVANRRRQGARAGINGGGGRELGFRADRNEDGEGKRMDKDARAERGSPMHGTRITGGGATCGAS